ncbi:carbon storage regulator [Klebsiella pneumoniae]|jgi:hypothetical protein|uniref:carbon storage regulator n=1 Tax=Klebsiella pneumoniae TaxID=573 RepID=UPI000D651B19|nr:carbon storage regulator [Klebsiella pneumoniae]
MIQHNLRLGEELRIGDTVVRMVKKSGQVAALVIDAPPEVKIVISKDREDSQKPRNPLTTS